METNKTENAGLSLLEKGKYSLIRGIFGRTGLVLLLLLLQAGILLAGFLWFDEHAFTLFGSHGLIALAMAVYIVNSRLDPTAKITWLLIIIPLPLFGALLYLFIRSELGHKTMRKKMGQIHAANKGAIVQDEAALARLEAEEPGAAALARYVGKSGCYPLFADCQVTYFPLGEDKFQAMLVELEKAERFIYLEYFIVAEGLMWGKILEILARKVAQGVDVRMMYDGTCEFALLPRSYPKKLEKLGIQCISFSPVAPFISTHYNYRDHRKILVIDGQVAFNGGINLSDEYINRVTRLGHWKDTAVMLKGPAVRSFTLMFLEMWDLAHKGQAPMPVFEDVPQPELGFVMPYGDDPLDGEKVGRQVYMDLLGRATRYVHIMTPYLILDGELEGALTYAAKRGVEVVLMLPGIPDKRTPYALAKTWYKTLLDAGVKVYEYAPGFVHAKVFVADGREAVVGTINLDYRSLYHHFECATYLYRTACITDIEADFQACIAKSRAVTYESIKKEKLTTKLLGSVAKLVAPLL